MPVVSAPVTHEAARYGEDAKSSITAQDAAVERAKANPGNWLSRRYEPETPPAPPPPRPWGHWPIIIVLIGLAVWWSIPA